MEQTLTVRGHIPVKKNRYRVGKNGGLYKPADVVDYEDNVREQVIVQRVRNMDEVAEQAGGLCVEAVFTIGGNERDTDGMLTSLLDALQDAGVFTNDKCVRRVVAEKRYIAGTKPHAEETTAAIRTV